MRRKDLGREDGRYPGCGGLTELLNEPAPSAYNLSGMTKTELLEYAEENGVDGVSRSMTKAKIIEALEGGQHNARNDPRAFE